MGKRWLETLPRKRYHWKAPWKMLTSLVTRKMPPPPKASKTKLHNEISLHNLNSGYSETNWPHQLLAMIWIHWNSISYTVDLHLESTLAYSKRGKHALTYNLTILLLNIYPRETKHIFPENFYANKYSYQFCL